MATPDTARQIAAMGSELGPAVLDQCKQLFDAQQSHRALALPPIATDLAYGPHVRHRLDLYAEPGGARRPVLVFVHGGGFLKGDKGGGTAWSNAAVGRMAAARGWLGVVINYRLAPDDMWPAGAEDVAAVVDWVRAHADEYGADPARIILCGTSAGAVHVAGYLKLRPGHYNDVCGAVLLSGLYGYTPLDDRDTLYFGPQSDYATRMPMDALVETGLPLLIACAQHDPPRFQAEFLGLMHARLAR
ncbi:MAG: hypothetical protein RLZZ58_783, partial [Pseudomonadota bacterium]